jgi:uracil-DNA glycosylase
MADTTFDYTLDSRQRNMLEAMGIQLWLPSGVGHGDRDPHANANAAAVTTTTTAAPTAPPSASKATFYEEKRASPPASIQEFAINRVANAVSLAPQPSDIAQMDWPALQSAVASCQACGLCQSRKNTVFGVGQPPADAAQAPQVDWLIVGEAPGENEDLQGEPFVGQAGKLLDNMLAAMKVRTSEDSKATGLSRHSGAYIANVIKCRPPANRNPSPDEVAMCEPYLARQIELLRPKIILAMGKFAIQSLTGSNEAVGKLRGRVHTLKHASYQAPVIVTYHPAYLLRNLPDKAKAWADLLLAMQTFAELAPQEAAASVGNP